MTLDCHHALVLKIKFQDNKHNVVYNIQCPGCDVSYIGECGRRITERVKGHQGRDKNSHVLKHAKKEH